MHFFCFFYVLFLTLVPQVILGFITYSREELLNIRSRQLTISTTKNMTFAKRILRSAFHPGQRNGSQPATPKNDFEKEGNEAVFWSDSGDGARVAFQRDIRDCNVLCFMETWLTGETLSETVQPAGFSTHRADRNKHLSGKKRGSYG